MNWARVCHAALVFRFVYGVGVACAYALFVNHTSPYWAVSVGAAVALVVFSSRALWVLCSADVGIHLNPVVVVVMLKRCDLNADLRCSHTAILLVLSVIILVSQKLSSAQPTRMHQNNRPPAIARVLVRPVARAIETKSRRSD
jgi:hypothetical protein